MKKQKILLITIIALFILIAVTSTYAVWVQNAGESKYLEFTTIDENPSIKYQIYVPIGEDGERIDGTMNVIERAYTLNNPTDIAEVAGYALVGIDAGVSIYRLELPNNYTMKIDGEEVTKPTKSIIVDEEFTAYNFSGNAVITEIEISSSIKTIQTGAFSFMSKLEMLKMLGNSDITIGDYAFGSCPLLNIIDKGNRTIIGNEALIFFRS